MKRIWISVLLSVWMSASLFGGVEVTLKSYQKARKNGKIVWVKAKKVIPGTVVRYVNTIKNNEQETIRNLVLKNHIPKHMRYISGSSKCKTPCTTYFSIDDGKHFALPEKLIVKDKKTGKVRKAKPSEYTTIQWVIDALEPGKKTRVSFKAKLL